MLERIRRRVAGDTKLDLTRTLQRLRSGLTPRTRATATAAADTSQQSTPAASARRPAAAAAAAPACTSPHVAAGEAGADEAGVMVAGDVEARGWAVWWPRLQAAAAQLTTHPDFQCVVLLVILLNCTGDWDAWVAGAGARMLLRVANAVA